jgi:hypothetical protein
VPCRLGERTLLKGGKKATDGGVGEENFSLAEKLSGRETRETLQKKRSTSGEVSTQGFFREVLGSKLREVLPPKPGENPLV